MLQATGRIKRTALDRLYFHATGSSISRIAEVKLNQAPGSRYRPSVLGHVMLTALPTYIEQWPRNGEERHHILDI